MNTQRVPRGTFKEMLSRSKLPAREPLNVPRGTSLRAESDDALCSTWNIAKDKGDVDVAARRSRIKRVFHVEHSARPSRIAIVFHVEHPDLPGTSSVSDVEIRERMCSREECSTWNTVQNCGVFPVEHSRDDGSTERSNRSLTTASREPEINKQIRKLPLHPINR